MKVAPSLLAADFLKLGEELRVLESAPADYIHYDIMDGIFVPNISFGFPILKQVCRATSIPVDAHLMAERPERYVGMTRDCGSAMMTVHAEACTHLHRTVHQIHEAGMKAGVALNPATPLVMLEEIIEDIDMVLLMSVNPGFGGQDFITGTLDKIRRLREMIRIRGAKVDIEVDGGVTLHTGRLLSEAGADILVSGSFIFKSENPRESILKLQSL